MTRWAMIADLERCVGCQTCTAACKHTNATSPAVQWRKVLDFELGAYPEVSRAFVPVGCMHCEDPPCRDVCPSKATKRRDDGVVTIDYDICIGCAYCAVACPYQARFKVDSSAAAYGSKRRMKHEVKREDPARIGVAQKCTFCSDRIDFGLANNMTPGVDPDATPACANACIAGALHFGDLDDPESNVSKLKAENETFRMHEELGTNPGFHYISKHGKELEPEPDALEHVESIGVGNVGGAAPWLQQHWDWRAAMNFIGGGAGSGLLVMSAILGLFMPIPAIVPLLGVGLVIFGLFMVFLETGRPLRAPINVLLNPGTSWMSREALFAPLVIILGIFEAYNSSIVSAFMVGIAAAGFLYCQARILKASKGIPAWRNPSLVPVIISTGLVEGVGLLSVSMLIFSPASIVQNFIPVIGFGVLLISRLYFWRCYRNAMRITAPVQAIKVLDQFDRSFAFAGHVLPLAFLVFMVMGVDMSEEVNSLVLMAPAIFAIVGGWGFKFVLITRASYNQGYAIGRSPQRGTGGSGPGAKPGWRVN